MPIFNHKTGSDDTLRTIRKIPVNYIGASGFLSKTPINSYNNQTN